ncbi:MAG: hypothetical protein EB116_10715 [Betaproteobacteria bacterium]|nr:hypothetical protein [Betaproteobacteria bacterium]
MVVKSAGWSIDKAWKSCAASPLKTKGLASKASGSSRTGRCSPVKPCDEGCNVDGSLMRSRSAETAWSSWSAA